VKRSDLVRIFQCIRKPSTLTFSSAILRATQEEVKETTFHPTRNHNQFFRKNLSKPGQNFGMHFSDLFLFAADVVKQRPVTPAVAKIVRYLFSSCLQYGRLDNDTLIEVCPVFTVWWSSLGKPNRLLARRR
jgi:hypothetical protein